MNEYIAIGIMSGSSLDGLDLCCARFGKKGDFWSYEIEAHATYNFDTALSEKLKNARSLSAIELAKLDIALGNWIGDQSVDFINQEKVTPMLIGSHGHTVFHQIEHSLSVQIGNPHAIAQKTGLKTIADFRQQNVLAEGNGAPLVPIGDLLLFREYDAFVNLGGIANLSIKQNKISGGDVVPCNQVLNAIVSKLGLSYDEGGNIARSGKVDASWLEILRQDPFFEKKLPKSISNEWVEERFLKTLPQQSPEDQLCTFTHFIAEQLSVYLKEANVTKVLLTGGGAHNSYLIDQIRDRLQNTDIVVPEDALIDAKEALIFAFMGVLRNLNLTNCLGSYTGANKDISAGVVYLP